MATLGTTLFALALTQLSYWTYGQKVGFQPFILLNVLVMASLFTPALAYFWNRQVSALRASATRLEALAWTDDLTGLTNRRAFFERADAILADPGSGNRAVLMFDLDNFKAINDSHGHDAGDRALVQVAHRIRDEVNGSGSTIPPVVARLGGEEFAALVSFQFADDVLAMADRIGAAVRTTPVFCHDIDLRITVSIGIAFCVARTTADAALKIADDALYDAKREGRDRWRARPQGGARFVTRINRRARTVGPSRAA